MLKGAREKIIGGVRDMTEPQTVLQTAREQLDETEIALGTGLADSVLGMVKIYFSTVIKAAPAGDPIAAIKGVASSASGINALLEPHGLPLFSETAWSQLCTRQQSYLTKQRQVEIVQETYSRAQTVLAQATVAGNETFLRTINDQILSTEMDIRYKRSILIPDSKGQGLEPAAPLAVLVSLEVPQAIGDACVWKSIALQYKANTSNTADLVKSGVGGSPSSSGCLIRSQGSATTNSTDISDTNVQVGFNVIKVDIQRPWMNASLFDQTKQFCRNADTPISAGPPQDISSALHSLKPHTPSDSDSSLGLLPSFPTSCIVVKDVHLIYSSDKAFSDATFLDVQSCATSGGGVLCFQARGTSNASGADLEHSSVRSSAKTVSVKIPAPQQILSWVSQLVAEDQTRPGSF